MRQPDPLIASLVSTGLGTLQLDATPPLVAALARYADEITTWGRRINLTGAKDAASFVKGPLFDALTLGVVLETRGTLADIGSGGGLPGIPAKLIAPELDIALVEPRSRRTAFLRHAVHMLDVSANIIACRDADIPPNSWDSAVSQAVWPASVWIRRAIRIVRPRGAIYVLSSAPINQTDLIEEMRVERAAACMRPWDHRTRYATRLRCC
ncbi:MAG: class I SAM-dependent methyltransferase [Myxococcota bacterium]|nr:class I SAM-dependent methyltransferase [Myxococcota bacterium]